MAVGRNIEPTPLQNWRALAKAMYEACGSPDVPGYPAKDVALALDGHRPMDTRMAAALVATVRNKTHMTVPVPSWPTTLLGSDGESKISFVGSTNVVLNMNYDPSWVVTPSPNYGFTTTAAWPQYHAGSDSDPGYAHYASRGASATFAVAPPHSATTATRALPPSDRERQKPVSPPPNLAPAGSVTTVTAGTTESASPAPARRRPRRPKGRIGPPPSPESATTAAEFMDRTRELWEWSGMAYRPFEEASKLVGDGRQWIARSTLSDLLRRDTLPDRTQLATIIAVLAPEEQARWEAVRLRLDTGGADPAPTELIEDAEILDVEPDPEPRPRGWWLRRSRKIP